MLECKKCGAKNKEEDYFCKKCGSKLAKPSLYGMEKTLSSLTNKTKQISGSLNKERERRKEQLPKFRADFERLKNAVTISHESISKAFKTELSEAVSNLQERTASQESLKKLANAFEARESKLLKKVRGIDKTFRQSIGKLEEIRKKASQKEIDNLANRAEKFISERLDKELREISKGRKGLKERLDKELENLSDKFRKTSATKEDVKQLASKLEKKLGKSINKEFKSISQSHQKLRAKQKGIENKLKERVSHVSELLSSLNESGASKKDLEKISEKIGKKFEKMEARESKLRSSYKKLSSSFRKAIERVRMLRGEVEKLERVPIEEVKVKKVPLEEVGKPPSKKRCPECKTLNDPDAKFCIKCSSKL